MNIQLTDEQLNGILAESKQKLIDAAVDSVRQRITWTMKDEIANEIKPIVKQFVLDEIVPELVDQLAGAKSQILEHVVAKASEIGTSFASALAKEVAERLGDDYKRRKLFESLFGSHF